MSQKNALPGKLKNQLVVFQEKAIRHTWHNEKWWFAIVDVVAVLTDSVQPDGYVKDLRRRDKELAKGWGQIATPLRIETEGGAQRVNCANTEGLFRIIQSITSPKAEPFKRWLAQVGYERVKEIENPELASARATFGVTPDSHSRLKGLHKVKTGNNLRDHMTDLELIFTMLGEAGTTEIARRKDAQGFTDNCKAAWIQPVDATH